MMLSSHATPSLFSSVAMKSVKLWWGVFDFRLLLPLSFVDCLRLLVLVAPVE
jgi:hypothetical protein